MKNMIKFSAVTLSILLLPIFPVFAQASSQPYSLNAEGYTDDAVRYEVQGTAYVRLTADSVFITRQVIYEGFVIPSDEVFWREKIKQTTYSGTLKLISHSFNAETRQTIAVYEGTLTAE